MIALPIIHKAEQCSREIVLNFLVDVFENEPSHDEVFLVTTFATDNSTLIWILAEVVSTPRRADRIFEAISDHTTHCFNLLSDNLPPARTYFVSVLQFQPKQGCCRREYTGVLHTN